MVIDEKGIPRIEPPEVPEPVIQEYVNWDYQRLYNENERIDRDRQRLRDSNTRMANYNFFLIGVVREQLQLIDKLVHSLEVTKRKITKETADRIEDFRRIAYPTPKKPKKNKT